MQLQTAAYTAFEMWEGRSYWLLDGKTENNILYILYTGFSSSLQELQKCLFDASIFYLNMSLEDLENM